MKKNATTIHKLTAINAALVAGMEINDELPLNDLYDDAMDFLFEIQKIEKEIEADSFNRNRNTQYMDCVLPCGGSAWWIDGELNFNAVAERYEEIAQDADGKIYLIFSRK